MADFTVRIRSGVNGALIWQYTDPRASQLHGRQMRVSIAKMVKANSPFGIKLLVGQERLDDDMRLQEYTTTHELDISVVRIQTRKPTLQEYDLLAESIGNNYANQVWRLVAQGLTLQECIPIRGRMTTNALVMSLQSPYLEMAESLHYPNVLKTLLLANCNPNDFGHPPKSPLAEATLRNDQDAVDLLISWKANVNIAARGEDYPLIIAVKQQRAHMVQALLEARADPTVRSFVQTRRRVEVFSWAGLTAQQLTYPGTVVARLIEDATKEWEHRRSENPADLLTEVD